MSHNATFRVAGPSEDETLARILYNSFRLNWDVNWWQQLSDSLAAVSPTRPSSPEQLTASQKARLQFYRSFISAVRLVGGIITVAVLPAADSATVSSLPIVILCWLPPGVHLTTYAIIRSGLLLSILRLGHLMGTWNLLYFEHKISQLYDRTLRPLGYKSRHDGAFVQIIGKTPTPASKGVAVELLRWQIQQHKQANRHVTGPLPVFLDTTGDYQQRAYERIGFRELGRQRLRIAINEEGLKCSTHSDFFQRVLFLDARDVE
ncbi:hypothetical protein BDY17DRAFT_320213 [Neohortaea acidophila]|uniref:N-acetyltransferase domain-containing protein n=1 Tax=Neohortaea acidophila TaxID=245834 RepID=A0A6A6Q5X6_9PEZI|nr:uncharacterized protein BDY17DRAFT_320213 [Neohortaea acidophila]KAF2487692.1 hypothetical protein BDY17DRAFT_320213 [Neohortaea acidophila]